MRGDTLKETVSVSLSIICPPHLNLDYEFGNVIIISKSETPPGCHGDGLPGRISRRGLVPLFFEKENDMEGFFALFGLIVTIIFFFLIVGIFSRLGDIREILKKIAQK